MCRGTDKTPGGFSLLEVLIALTLLGLISGTVYGTWFSLSRARDIAVGRLAEERDLRQCIDQLRREIAAAWYRKPTPAEATNKPRLRFVVEDRDWFGKPVSTLTLTTIAPPVVASSAISDQREVRYRPLVRENRLVLTRESRDLYRQGGSVPYPLLERIDGFLVECWNGSAWIRSWDADLMARPLPEQVRITLTLSEGDRKIPYTFIARPRVPR